MIKIFLSENSERVEEESILRGCRADVLVDINGSYYVPFVNTIERLSQEVRDAFKQGIVYDIDPCQIIVPIADKYNIIKTILFLYNEGFFDAFVPVSLTTRYQHTFPHLSDVSNWTKIY